VLASFIVGRQITADRIDLGAGTIDLSGIVFVNRNGPCWCDAPRDMVHKMLYNRWKRCGKRGVFLCVMESLAAASATPKTIMIDATYRKAHRTASSLRVKRGPWAAHRTHQWGINTKLHAVTVAEGRPLSRLLEPIGNIPPAEAEDQYYAAADNIDMAA